MDKERGEVRGQTGTGEHENSINTSEKKINGIKIIIKNNPLSLKGQGKM